jgi:hypothetical protein
VTVSTVPGHAACPQTLAIYSDRDKSMTIEFRPNDTGFASVSNVFRVVLAGDHVLQGIVQWNNGESRPNGTIMNNCPEGDVTGQELDECVIWEGVIYSIGSDGTADLLPEFDAPAAGKILLPDFGRQLRYSLIWDDRVFATVPWDLMELSGCQE